MPEDDSDCNRFHPYGKQAFFSFFNVFISAHENVTESNKICAVAHILTYWLQKEIDNSRREK
jgi:hypothetical protein